MRLDHGRHRESYWHDGGGGANGDGTVFEVAKTANGYASAPITLVNFSGADGASPNAPLIADAAGNLLGTTLSGGVEGDGTVFEVAKTATGYASTPITVASFNNSDGSVTMAGVVTDAAGNLFGTTTPKSRKWNDRDCHGVRGPQGS